MYTFLVYLETSYVTFILLFKSIYTKKFKKLFYVWSKTVKSFKNFSFRAGPVAQHWAASCSSALLSMDSTAGAVLGADYGALSISC